MSSALALYTRTWLTSHHAIANVASKIKEATEDVAGNKHTGAAAELRGEASGKTSELAGKAKGAASEMAGRAEGTAEKVSGKAKGAAEQAKQSL